MSAAITAVATGIVGIGSSIYGAKQSAKAMDKANATNKKIADEANRLNYEMWLESRGIDAEGNAVNTKLPRWATTSMTSGRTGFRVKQRTPYSGSITAPRTPSA